VSPLSLVFHDVSAGKLWVVWIDFLQTAELQLLLYWCLSQFLNVCCFQTEKNRMSYKEMSLTHRAYPMIRRFGDMPFFIQWSYSWLKFYCQYLLIFPPPLNITCHIIILISAKPDYTEFQKQGYIFFTFSHTNLTAFPLCLSRALWETEAEWILGLALNEFLIFLGIQNKRLWNYQRTP
jgi:hypothetical protein